MTNPAKTLAEINKDLSYANQLFCKILIKIHFLDIAARSIANHADRKKYQQILDKKTWLERVELRKDEACRARNQEALKKYFLSFKNNDPAEIRNGAAEFLKAFLLWNLATKKPKPPQTIDEFGHR